MQQILQYQNVNITEYIYAKDFWHENEIKLLM